MRKRITLILALTLSLSLLLGGCGTKTLNVGDSVEVKFHGMNGYGTASTSNAYDWESEIVDDEKATFMGILEKHEKIMNAVDYELSKTSNLKNGDKITLSIKVNNEVLKQYGYSAKAMQKEYVVSGLEEPKSIDLFENIDVVFDGKSPYGTAKLNTTYKDRPFSVSYELDKTENLANGDVVTITAKVRDGADMDAGYIVENKTKEVTVTGLNKIIMGWEDIDQASFERMVEETSTCIESRIVKTLGWDSWSAWAHYADKKDSHCWLSKDWFKYDFLSTNYKLKTAYFATSKKENWVNNRIDRYALLVYEVNLRFSFTEHDPLHNSEGVDDLTLYIPVSYSLNNNFLTSEDEMVFDFYEYSVEDKYASFDWNEFVTGRIAAKKADYEFVERQ